MRCRGERGGHQKWAEVIMAVPARKMNDWTPVVQTGATAVGYLQLAPALSTFPDAAPSRRASSYGSETPGEFITMSPLRSSSFLTTIWTKDPGMERAGKFVT
jgi:hypothetical protein